MLTGHVVESLHMATNGELLMLIHSTSVARHWLWSTIKIQHRLCFTRRQSHHASVSLSRARGRCTTAEGWGWPWRGWTAAAKQEPWRQLQPSSGQP